LESMLECAKGYARDVPIGSKFAYSHSDAELKPMFP